MSYRNGKRAGVPEIRLKDNVLTAGCKCDSVLIYAMLRQREVTVDRDSKQQITPPPIEVKYIPGWMWFFGITGMLFWAIILIWLLVKYFKKH
jgi:hypothetical protein